MIIKIGDRVIAHKMATDSFYKQVIGKVMYIRNGYVGIDADLVSDLWSLTGEFKLRDVPVSTSAHESVVTLF